MKKALLALSFGTLALGVAEFVMMAILPFVTADLGVSIPAGGNLITAYALGVCLGSPAIVLLRHQPLKRLLLCMMLVCLAGNMCATFAPGYWTLIGARFLSGLPHGAYFGVASIVAIKVAPEGKSASAVAAMVAGMTVANLAGVPLGTFVSHALTWRVAFGFVALCALLVAFLIWKWVPDVGSLPKSTFRSQFRFLKSLAPWLILMATMFGNGGIFAWYSYINPMLTTISGFPERMVSPLMILAGLGMVLGNAVSGPLCDKFRPGRMDSLMQLFASLCMLSFFFWAECQWLVFLLLPVTTATLFAISSPQQTLIVKFAPGGELLGGACIQMAFNLGNAVGAQAGAVPLRLGLDYHYPALVGACVTVLGCVSMYLFSRRYERG